MWDFADVYKKDQFAFSYLTLHEWVYKKRKGKKIGDFLNRNGIHHIALCGYGSLGEVILPTFLEEGLDIAFIVDKNPLQFESSVEGIPVIAPDCVAGQGLVDAYIVCHVYYYNSIADMLVCQGIPAERVLSLNDVVFSL